MAAADLADASPASASDECPRISANDNTRIFIIIEKKINFFSEQCKSKHTY